MCDHPGDTTQLLSGTESTLPGELKNLKVYEVALNNEGHIKIAILNDKINALEYSSGKTSQSVAILDNSQGFRREIPVREIVFENDSMMLVRK